MQTRDITQYNLVWELKSRDEIKFNIAYLDKKYNSTEHSYRIRMQIGNIIQYNVSLPKKLKCK